MIRIRYLIIGFLLFFFVSIFLFGFYIFVIKDVMGARSWRKLYFDNKVQSIERAISQADTNVRNLIEDIQMICATKIVNTSDRILLNTLFIPFFIQERSIKSIQAVLPNKVEYIISPYENGWRTVFQIWSEKGLLRKKAVWAEDGIQMLDENIEEVPITESLTSLEWYKKSIELSLLQAHKNRRGTPKIWINKPFLDENERSILSQVGIAVGYDDAPFSAICLTLEWSWLQNAVNSIYREQNVETYIICDDLIISRVGLNYGNIDKKIVEEYLRVEKLSYDVKTSIDRFTSSKSKYNSEVRDGRLLYALNYPFLYDFPLLCFFDIPVPVFETNRDIWRVALLIGIVGLIMVVSLSLILTYLFEKPIEKATHWLENPTEREFSPKDFFLYEYYVLVNKFNYILKFLRPLYEPAFLSGNVSDAEQKDTTSVVIHGKTDKKDIFVFSENGVGGVAIEVFENLQRENIRLQKQIEVLNIFYTTQLNLSEKEKSKYQNYLVGIMETLALLKKESLSETDKYQKILSVLNSTIGVDYSLVLKINTENKRVTKLISFPELDHFAVPYSAIEEFFTSESKFEVLPVKSISQHLNSLDFLRSINAKSILLAPVRYIRENEVVILFVISSEEKNWEPKDEVYLTIISRILGMYEDIYSKLG